MREPPLCVFLARGDHAAHLVARAQADARAPRPAGGSHARRLVRPTRCSSRRRARSSSSSSPTRTQAASAGPRSTQARSRTILLDDEFDLTARVIRTAARRSSCCEGFRRSCSTRRCSATPNAAAALEEEISIRSAITVHRSARARRTFGAAHSPSRRFGSCRTPTSGSPTELAARAAIAVENARLYREAEQRAEASLALAYVGDGGIILLDDDGRVRFWNAAAAAITGDREADAVGRHPAEVFPAWQELTRLAELAGAATPEQARPTTVPIETASRDGWVRGDGRRQLARASSARPARRPQRRAGARARARRLRRDPPRTSCHALRSPRCTAPRAPCSAPTSSSRPGQHVAASAKIIVSETESG